MNSPQVKAYMESHGFRLSYDGNCWLKNIEPQAVTSVSCWAAEFFYEQQIASTRRVLEDLRVSGPAWAEKAYYTKHPVLWSPIAPEGNAEHYDAGFNQANEIWRQKLDQMISALERKGNV